MSKSEMFVCPKAKECAVCYHPHHSTPHLCSGAARSLGGRIRYGSHFCPPCLPVSEGSPPEEPKPKCPYSTKADKRNGNCFAPSDFNCAEYNCDFRKEPKPDKGLVIGKAYKVINRRFPFDCPYGIYVEKLPNEFLRFIYEGKDMMMNGGQYELFEPIHSAELRGREDMAREIMEKIDREGWVKGLVLVIGKYLTGEEK